METVNYDRKEFYDTGPWCQCYNTFYGRNLRMLVISYSVCPWQAFPAYTNVCKTGSCPIEEPFLWSTRE